VIPGYEELKLAQQENARLRERIDKLRENAKRDAEHIERLREALEKIYKVARSNEVDEIAKQALGE
jgi:Txe/YoeB family toxin of Txe-Axe toxin-antitoxin module